MSQGRTRYSTRGAAAWAVAAVVTTTVLGAQAPPSLEKIYVVQGAIRDTKAEALYQGDSLSGTRSLRVYGIGASLEQIFRHYVKRFHAQSDGEHDSLHAPVTPPAPAAGSSPVLYHLVFHAFDDECMDAAPNAGAECRRWRRGKDKKRALADARIGYEQGEFAKWIDVGTFTWLTREPNGDLVRYRVDVRDAGLSPDWRRHSPLAHLVIEGVRLPPDAP